MLKSEQSDNRISTLDGNTQSIDHEYLVHAANVLPELLAAAENLQRNWEHNLTEPMARLNEAIEIAEDINTTALRAKPWKRGWSRPGIARAGCFITRP